MFCFSKTCRICKCTTNSFNSTCNNTNEWSHMFLNMFPELVNSKLNNFLRNVCTFCMKQLTLFANFKNHCIQSDQCFLQYLNQLEDHDGTHAERIHELGMKLEYFPNESQTQSTLENNDTHEATNYYDPTLHSRSSTDDIAVDIKQETSRPNNKETIIEESESNIIKQTNSISDHRESESRDIQDTVIKQEMFISDYDESGIQRILIDSSVNIPQDVPSISNIKQEYCQEKDDLSNTAQYDLKQEYCQGKDDLSNIAENGISEIDILKHEICIADTEGPCNANVHSNLMTIDSVVNNKESQKIACAKLVYCQGKDDMIQQIHKDNDIHPYECDDRPFVCDICEMGFVQKSHMIIHKRTHFSEKPYECDVCQKRFSQKQKLVTHKMTHTGERPYVCDICDKSFTQKPHMIVHRSTHTGDRPYECDICEKSFVWQSHMLIHKRTHSGEKPYNCDKCKKSFSLKHTLITHIRTHTGDRPYVCNICNKSFSQKNSLVRHKRTHTDEKPFDCDVCGKSFALKHNLIAHIRTHTVDRPHALHL